MHPKTEQTNRNIPDKQKNAYELALKLSGKLARNTILNKLIAVAEIPTPSIKLLVRAAEGPATPYKTP